MTRNIRRTPRLTLRSRVETRPGEELPKRLLVLYSSLREVIGRLAPDIVAVERHLSELLGIGVAIQYAGGGKGALTLKFASLDQLDMICQRLSGESI